MRPWSMPTRPRPGRPGRGETPAPQRKRTVYVPVEVDLEYEQLAAEEGTATHAVMRRALIEWMAARKGPGG